MFREEIINSVASKRASVPNTQNKCENKASQQTALMHMASALAVCFCQIKRGDRYMAGVFTVFNTFI